MRNIPLTDATDEQLKVFALNKGLTFPANIGREALTKKVKAVIDGDSIELPGENPPAAEADEEEQPEDRVARASQARAAKQRVGGQGNTKQIVRIHTSELEGGDEPVFLACNGKGIWIPRGIWVRVKVGYVNSLRAAKEEKYDMEKDPATGLDRIKPTPRMVPRYGFEVWAGAGDPPGEEVHECVETTGNAAQARPNTKRRVA